MNFIIGVNVRNKYGLECNTPNKNIGYITAVNFINNLAARTG